MSLRINPDLYRDLLAMLGQNREAENRALAQIASGRRINSLADDPGVAAALVQNRAEARSTDQFSRNVAGLRPLLQVVDSTLSSVIQLVTRVISLGIQGANGTLSPENRRAVAREVRGLREQLLSAANLSFRSAYVFAGTAVTTRPFVADAGDPSGVRYDGNANVTDVEIADGATISINLPGSRLFSQPGANLFLALQHLIDGLESGSGIEAAVSEVQEAFDHVNEERAFSGSALARLDAADLLLGREKFELSREENDLVGADLAAAATNLIKAQEAGKAALAAGARISQLSLLDYLR